QIADGAAEVRLVSDKQNALHVGMLTQYLLQHVLVERFCEPYIFDHAVFELQPPRNDRSSFLRANERTGDYSVRLKIEICKRLRLAPELCAPRRSTAAQRRSLSAHHDRRQSHAA